MLQVSSQVPEYDNQNMLLKTVMQRDQGFLPKYSPADDMNYRQPGY
jgi:hypothetical protein